MNTFRSRGGALRALAAWVGLAGCLTLTARADAQAPAEPDAPIRIERCAILSRSELPDPFNGLRDERVSGVSVAFSNRRSVAVTLVQFSVRYQGSSESVAAPGIFEPNVRIDRTFSSFAGDTAGPDAAVCSVKAATFRDGTTWNAER